MNKKYSISKSFIIFLMMLLFFYGVKVRAQIDPVEVIEISLEAQGGREALEKVKDKIINANVQVNTVQGSFVGLSLMYIKTEPAKIRVEQTLAGMKTITGFDGQTVWLERMEDVIPAPIVIASPLKATITRESLLLKYRERECSVEYLGEDDVDNQPCYEIKLTDKKGQETIFCIDTSTYLPVRIVYYFTSTGGAEVLNEVILGDYRYVDDILLSFHTATFINGIKASESVITEYKINQGLDDSLFSIPEKP